MTSIPSLGPFLRITDFNFGRRIVTVDASSGGQVTRFSPDESLSASSGACSAFADCDPLLAEGVGGVSLGGDGFNEDIFFVPPDGDNGRFRFRVAKSTLSSSNNSDDPTGASYGAGSGVNVQIDIGRVSAGPDGIIIFTASAGAGSAAVSGDDPENPNESATAGANVSISFSQEGQPTQTFSDDNAGGISMTCQLDTRTNQLTRIS